MSRKDKIDRHPVPENTCRAFMSTMWTLAKAFGVDKIPGACHYLQLAGEELDRHVFEQNNPAVTKHKDVSELRRYIAIFRGRYLDLADFEYTSTVTPIEGKMVSQLCATLQEKGFTVDEYLKWLFEEFLPVNDKFSPPQLRWTCCAFITTKFFYENKELMKERKDKDVRAKLTADLINRARVCMRKHPEDVEKIKEILKKFWDGGIVIDEMRKLIEGYEALGQTTQGQNQAKMEA